MVYSVPEQLLSSLGLGFFYYYYCYYYSFPAYFFLTPAKFVYEDATKDRSTECLTDSIKSLASLSLRDRSKQCETGAGVRAGPPRTSPCPLRRAGPGLGGGIAADGQQIPPGPRQERDGGFGGGDPDCSWCHPASVTQSPSCAARSSLDLLAPI